MGLVILPYRVSKRDFYSRLLLSHRLTSILSRPVLVCSDQVADYLSYLYSGIILIDTPSTNSNWHDLVIRVSNNSGCIFLMDEDGVNNLSASNVDFWTSRIPVSLHKYINNIFCWGSYDYSYFSDLSSTLTPKLVITGNPRLDLLQFHGSFLFNSSIENLKKSLGDFSLVIDGFGLGSEFDTDISSVSDSLASPPLLYDAQSDSINSLQYHRRSYFTHRLIELLLSHQSTTFVVRPHPTSSLGFWNLIASRFQNVVVDSSLSIEPWLFAASNVITMSSTVSLQAVYSRKELFDIHPPIHLRSPELDSIFNQPQQPNNSFLSRFDLSSQTTLLSSYWQIPYPYHASIDFISDFLISNVPPYESSISLQSILQSLMAFKYLNQPIPNTSLHSLGLSNILNYCANLQTSPYLESVEAVHVNSYYCLFSP